MRRGSPGRRCLAAAFIALAASSIVAMPANAQDLNRSGDGIGWTIDARAGLALAAGNLAEIEGTGPSFGAGVGYYLGSRVSLRLDFGLDLLPGEPTFFDAADLDAWYAQAGVAYLLTHSNAPLFVDVGGMAGLTVLSFNDDRVEDDVRPGYALVGRIGRAIAPNADIALRSALQFVDVPDDTWTIWQVEAVIQFWN